ncbi:MAG TPA: hypothetical protein VFG52_12090 [Xanthomonadales bacterium]|nr:hypothetical protein [Xanthomonadales bacterium]
MAAATWTFYGAMNPTSDTVAAQDIPGIEVAQPGSTVEALGSSTEQRDEPVVSPLERDETTAFEKKAESITKPVAETELTAEQLIVLREVEADLAAALAGDDNLAAEMGAFLNQCQFAFRDRRRVEQAIERTGRSFAEGKPLTQFRPSGPARKYETLEEFEADQWDTFYRCEASRTLINDSFWQKLEQQADAGNPAARYLFATLIRQSHSGNLAFDRWDEELALREQAREYTSRNLAEREPLGLLALAFSEGVNMNFGAGRTAMTGVLVLAAVKCGLTTPDLLQSVDQALQVAEHLEKTQPGVLEQLNTASDEARQMFCR